MTAHDAEVAVRPVGRCIACNEWFGDSDAAGRMSLVGAGKRIVRTRGMVRVGHTNLRTADGPHDIFFRFHMNAKPRRRGLPD